MEDFCYAGGLPVVMRLLAEKGLIDGDAITVTGQSVWDNVKAAENFNKEVIRDFNHALADEGGIAVLKGNLAPKGAVLKPQQRPPP